MFLVILAHHKPNGTDLCCLEFRDITLVIYDDKIPCLAPEINSLFRVSGGGVGKAVHVAEER